MNPISSTPFYFKIHPITSYIDLSKIYILTECRIRKIAVDGIVSDLVADDIVAPIQMPGATWIKDMKILINQREVYSSNQLYSYKTYLDTELSYPLGPKDSFLNASGYIRDQKDPDSVNDEGFKARKNMFAESKKVQLISKLSADILNQDLYLISNVEVDIEITPQPSEFMLIQKKQPAPTQRQQQAADEKYIFEITDVRLLVKTIDLMDGLSLEIANRLDSEPARYGIRKTFMKSLFITQGRTDFTANLYTEE